MRSEVFGRFFRNCQQNQVRSSLFIVLASTASCFASGCVALRCIVRLAQDPIAHASESARDLIKRLLALDPVERATCTEVEAHLWLAEDA
mmetsp:Transcript_81295/g.263678  ORF Transcript_81295/g.263678 Transcript_81295/m.263678 type:complete len:90 (+) Transcript_81295:126-395(+)